MQKNALKTIFNLSLIEERKGIIIFKVKGNTAKSLFENESGGHRFQHISKNKVHTSTITVAVLPEPSQTQFSLNNKDLEIFTCRGSGNGGQHRNTTDSAVQIKHIPTNIMVRAESERSQHLNKELALSALRAKLYHIQQNKDFQDRSNNRKSQVGSGQRGDKRRSYYYQRNEVVDHILNRTWNLKEYFKGNW